MYDFLKFVHRKTYELEMIYQFHSEITHFEVKIQCNFENYHVHLKIFACGANYLFL